MSSSAGSESSKVKGSGGGGGGKGRGGKRKKGKSRQQGQQGQGQQQSAKHSRNKDKTHKKKKQEAKQEQEQHKQQKEEPKQQHKHDEQQQHHDEAPAAKDGLWDQFKREVFKNKEVAEAAEQLQSQAAKATEAVTQKVMAKTPKEAASATSGVHTEEEREEEVEEELDEEEVEERTNRARSFGERIGSVLSKVASARSGLDKTAGAAQKPLDAAAAAVKPDAEKQQRISEAMRAKVIRDLDEEERRRRAKREGSAAEKKEEQSKESWASKAASQAEATAKSSGFLDKLRQARAFVRQEVQHLEELVPKSLRGSRMFARNREIEDQIDPRTGKLALTPDEVHLIKTARDQGLDVPDIKELRRKKNEEIRRRVQGLPNKKAEGEINTEETQLVVAEREETVWARRMRKLREELAEDANVKKAAETAEKVAENEFVKPVVGVTRSLKEKLQDKIEDARESYETSQHPLVWKLRDWQDGLLTQDEETFALGELIRIDSSFQPEMFAHDMGRKFLPNLMYAFLSCDEELIEEMVLPETQASMFFKAVKAERETLGQVQSTKLYQVGRVHMVTAMIHEDEPHVLLSFMAQYEHKIMDREGKVIEGMAGMPTTAHGQVMVKRDLDDPEAPWKAVEVAIERRLALAERRHQEAEEMRKQQETEDKDKKPEE